MSHIFAKVLNTVQRVTKYMEYGNRSSLPSRKKNFVILFIARRMELVCKFSGCSVHNVRLKIISVLLIGNLLYFLSKNKVVAQKLVFKWCHQICEKKVVENMETVVQT